MAHLKIRMALHLRKTRTVLHLRKTSLEHISRLRDHMALRPHKGCHLMTGRRNMGMGCHHHPPMALRQDMDMVPLMPLLGINLCNHHRSH